ncbi:MAG TPA: D-aminoacylase [Vicinamibacteria bacterium]|nr:D-aminoacylase [Vicinamibacteria bacterium]
MIAAVTLALLVGGGDAAYDLVLAGGSVVDGTGAPARTSDVGIVGDRIAAVGDLAAAQARRRVDARGLVVAPGFIDMLGQSEYNVLVDPRAASKVTQGITTEITGEGTAIAPLSARMIEDARAVYDHYGVAPDWTTLAGYWKAFVRARPAINLGTFVGAGGVRKLVMGSDNRPPTTAELEEMKRQVAQAMEEGAFGLSTSLIYVPGRFARTSEIVELAKVARRYGGTYITHQRDEGDVIFKSLDEVFRIAREAQVPAEIYHLKTAGRVNWGKMPAVLRRIEQARAEGLDVTANVYPWTASANALEAALPAWAREGGRAKLVERLKDPKLRERVTRDLLKENRRWDETSARAILITWVIDPALKRYEGKTLVEIGREQEKLPHDAMIDLLIAGQGNVGRITFSMSEDDVRAAVRHPLVSMCTDSGAVAEDGVFSDERSHPRGWASTARILGRYVRDEKLLPLEEAVRKMTSLPATRMRLGDRGVVRPGAFADLVAFDLARVRERSTYADPSHYSEGFPYVAVNGELVVDQGRLTGARPGRPLYGPGKR